ncbi:MAG: nucleotidyltransferase domain-containing protein [Candidatus Omnitrophota bacterium]
MNFDWQDYFNAGGEHSWMPSRTIFLTLHGSHAYGTNTPQSDLDIRGVVVAQKPYYTGILKSFEQEVLKNPDLVIFEIRKFIYLASECNPNTLEILFTHPEQHLFVSPIGQALLDHKRMFLSRRARETFLGYATEQMRKIELHRRWILDPPDHEPTRAEFGLSPIPVHPAKNQIDASMAMVKKKVDSWNWHKLEYIAPSMRQAIRDEFQRRLVEVTSWADLEVEDKVWHAAANSLGLTTNFIQVLELEKRYASKKSDWSKFQKWKKSRNPERAIMEAKFGYDGKHAMHLVRLSRSCRDLLTTGNLDIRRPDAEELLAIRNGAWKFEELVSWFKQQNRELNQLEKTSPLPPEPDVGAIDQLCQELVERAWVECGDS